MPGAMGIWLAVLAEEAMLADQRLDQHLTEPRVNSLPGQEAFHRHSQEQGITLADQVVLNCLGTLIAFHFTDEIPGTQFGEDKDCAIAPGFTDGVLTFQDNVDSMDPGPLFFRRVSRSFWVTIRSCGSIAAGGSK